MESKAVCLMININIFSTPVMVDLQDYIKIKMLSFFEVRDKIAFSKNQAKLEKYNISVTEALILLNHMS